MKLKSFTDWLIEKTTGTYVGFKLSEESENKIIELTKELKLETPIKKDDIHITVIYSRKFLPKLKKGTYNDFDKQECPIKEFKLFGDVLVLVLDSDFCKQRHEELMSTHKATYDFEEYIPHISIGYGVKELPHPLTKPFLIEIEKIYVEDLELDWKDRYTEDE